MSPNLILSGLVMFLHDLFTAIWIGGLIALALSVFPATRRSLERGPAAKKLIAAVQKRQSTLVYLSIAGLLVTGLLQAKREPAFEGLLAVGNAYSAALAIKHALVLAMIAVALYRSLVLGRGKGPAGHWREKLNAGLLYLNVALGVVVLLLSGLLAALANAPAL
jgi:putative copper export protein